jgi:hypothetical protein
VILVPRE